MTCKLHFKASLSTFTGSLSCLPLWFLISLLESFFFLMSLPPLSRLQTTPGRSLEPAHERKYHRSLRPPWRWEWWASEDSQGEGDPTYKKEVLPVSSPNPHPSALPTLGVLGFIFSNKASISLILRSAKLYIRHCGGTETNRLRPAPSNSQSTEIWAPGPFQPRERSWIHGALQMLFSKWTYLKANWVRIYVFSPRKIYWNAPTSSSPPQPLQCEGARVRVSADDGWPSLLFVLLGW